MIGLQSMCRPRPSRKRPAISGSKAHASTSNARSAWAFVSIVSRIGVRVDRSLAPAIAQKGSITLDGVSLTVNEVRNAEDGTHFSVNIIPHTAHETTLGDLTQGRQLNVEIDVIARYIDRMLATRAQ